MITIHKYPLAIEDTQTVELPEGAEILRVEALSKDTFPVSVYNAKLFLWAKVDPEARMVSRTVFIFGTGHEIIPSAARYLGTIFTSPLVFHVFIDAGNH